MCKNPSDRERAKTGRTAQKSDVQSPESVLNMQNIKFVVLLIILIIIEEQCDAFVVDSGIASHRRCTLSLPSSSSLFLNRNHNSNNNNNNNNNDFNVDRRSVLQGAIATSSLSTFLALLLPTKAAIAENETMERGGIKLTPFNSLAFNYREGQSPTIDSSTLNNEPSITYIDFLSRLDSGTITYVEFLAPYGNVAYATYKEESKEDENSSAITSSRKRIGEGYPIEDPTGWSSPAFVIKAVAKKGVPYKFIVPGIGGG